MSEIIPIKFDEPSQRASILSLLGGVYNDPRDALKEYVANAIDADASQIIVDVTSRKRGVVEIRDNGSGMTLEKLRAVPNKVGLSDKFLIENRIGEKAIGILAFYSLGANALVFWSKNGPEQHSLRLVKGDLNPVLDSEDVSPTHPWLKNSSGTVVQLQGIPSDVARLLTVEKIKDHLSKLYREVLRQRPIRMLVIEGKTSETVTFESFGGEQFWMRDILTKFGRIELSLFILPTPSHRSIEVFCKGQRVCDVTELGDRFQVSPWNSGYSHGVVAADFLKPTTGRTGFATNPAFTTFADKLHGIAPQLQKAIDTEVQQFKNEQDRTMQRELNDTFLRAILELRTQGWNAAESLVAGGRETTGQPTNTARGVRGSGSSTKRPTTKHPSPRPLVNPGNGLPASRGFGINWDETAFDTADAHLRSKFDPTQSLVLINMLHSDYREEYPDRRRRYQYFHLLLAKEITLYNWGKEAAKDLLEHLVELDVYARRFRTS